MDSFNQFIEESQQVEIGNNKKDLNEKSVVNKKQVKNKKPTLNKKSYKHINKENLLPPQHKTIGANKKQMMYTPDNSVSSSFSPRNKTHHKLNENIPLLHRPSVSVVPYFKKTPMPINSPNLQRTTHLPTNKITVTKSENFGMSSWSSHTPHKSSLPKPPSHWILKESSDSSRILQESSVSPGAEEDRTMSTPARLSPCPRSPCMSSTCSQLNSPLFLTPIGTPSSGSSLSLSSKSSVPSSRLSSKHFKFSRATLGVKTRNISIDLDKIEDDTEVDSDESNLEDVAREKREASQDSGFVSEKDDVENKSKEEGDDEPNLLLMAILNSLAIVEDSFTGNKPLKEDNDGPISDKPIKEENEELSAILNSLEEDFVPREKFIKEESEDLSVILNSIKEDSVPSDKPVNENLSAILKSLVEESGSMDKLVNEENEQLSAILNSLVKDTATNDIEELGNNQDSSFNIRDLL